MPYTMDQGAFQGKACQLALGVLLNCHFETTTAVTHLVL